MTHHENLKVLAFVGLNDAGREAATHYFTEQGYPKVRGDNVDQQIQHLADAGQHRIILDVTLSQTDYRALQHEFPGELVAITPTVNSTDESSSESFHDQLRALAEDAGF